MEQKREKITGTCESCRWAGLYDPNKMGGGGFQLEYTCRINAPTTDNPAWPIVSYDDWCGKWLDSANEKNRSGLVGDVLTYAMRRDNVSFPEAVELVWATIGQKD